MSNKEYRFLSWQDIERDCFFIYSQMLRDNYKPEAIVGLLRGGVVPARIFSDFFGILLDFFALDVKLYNGIDSRMSVPIVKPFFGDIKGKKTLIIDDIWDSGKTMEAALESLKGEDITTATLYWKETAKNKPDYYASMAKDNEWIVFAWETWEFRRLTGKFKNKEI